MNHLTKLAVEYLAELPATIRLRHADGTEVRGGGYAPRIVTATLTSNGYAFPRTQFDFMSAIVGEVTTYSIEIDGEEVLRKGFPTPLQVGGVGDWAAVNAEAKIRS